jgi:hypothetical protein
MTATINEIEALIFPRLKLVGNTGKPGSYYYDDVASVPVVCLDFVRWYLLPGRVPPEIVRLELSPREIPGGREFAIEWGPAQPLSPCMDWAPVTCGVRGMWMAGMYYSLVEMLGRWLEGPGIPMRVWAAATEGEA